MLYRQYVYARCICIAAFTFVAGAAFSQAFPAVRVAPSERNFQSIAIDSTIHAVQGRIADKELAWLFYSCFPNTLDRTVSFSVADGRPDTFVITGDIHAMWLRDCTAQVWPYLPFVSKDVRLKELIAGVINRQVRSILIDPYANAFNKDREGSYWESDVTEMKPELHERKWELDGLCYVIRLSHEYWKVTGDASLFDARWQEAMSLVVKTFKEQQRLSGPGPYRFLRKTTNPTDTQFGNGYGNPVRTTGLICSMFRPSDDATIYPYLIPSNCFAVVALKQLAEIQRLVLKNVAFANECVALANVVDGAIKQYGIVNHPKYGKIYAFEVDGYGNYLMMDDANVPSLLALPYLGYVSTSDKVYQNTRKFVWSDDNPYFYRGKFAEGIGGPHIGADMIWPMSIIMRALTSNSKSEVEHCLVMLKRTHAGTGFMHESFHKDNPNKFTRAWFAWANTLFGELMLRVDRDYPDLLAKIY